MLNEMFENLCRKSNDLKEILQKKEYEQLIKEIPNLGSFDDYKKEQNNLFHKSTSSIDKNITNDILINTEEIIKDNYKIDIYLFKFKIIDENLLDKEYKVKNLKYINVYEYNTIITNKLNNDYVNGIFCKQLYNKKDAINEYENLKKWMYNTSMEEIIKDAEKRISVLLDMKN